MRAVWGNLLGAPVVPACLEHIAAALIKNIKDRPMLTDEMITAVSMKLKGCSSDEDALTAAQELYPLIRRQVLEEAAAACEYEREFFKGTGKLVATRCAKVIRGMKGGE